MNLSSGSPFCLIRVSFRILYSKKALIFCPGVWCNGITFILTAAEILTDIITGKKNKPAQIFSFNRI